MSRDAGLHWAQVLFAPTQRARPSLRPAQSVSATHSTHALVPPSPRLTPASRAPRQRGRAGVTDAQSGSKLHVLVQVPTRAGSFEVQKRPAGQRLRIASGEQPSTQRRVPGSQTRPDVFVPQSASVAQPQKAAIIASGCTQARPAGFIAHAVASPPAPGTHSTQTSLGAHTGVAPTQAAAFAMVHCTQAPEAEHAGVVPPHSASPMQPRHVCEVASQRGVVARQSAAVTQPTHAPAAVSHTGVVPMHAAVLVAEHWPHAPEG
jgi:hypothetical protein